MEVVKTKTLKPPRILIHAEHKIGKSSFAASAESPLFINIEDGLSDIDATALPLCKDFDTVLAQLRWVYSSEHEYKTLVLDSVDWLEMLISQHVCRAGGKQSIGEFEFGAGYTAMTAQLGVVIKALDAIRSAKNMAIVLLAHSEVRQTTDPLVGQYDRHSIKLRDKNAAMLMEWVDVIGYMHCSVYASKTKAAFGQEVTKVVGGADRVLSVSPHAAYMAGNRYWIKDDIECTTPADGWSCLMQAIRGGSNNG